MTEPKKPKYDPGRYRPGTKPPPSENTSRPQPDAVKPVEKDPREAIAEHGSAEEVQRQRLRRLIRQHKKTPPKPKLSPNAFVFDDLDDPDKIVVGDEVGEVSEERLRPGAFNMAGKIELHTQLAVNLFRGRRENKAKKIRTIVGLTKFAADVAVVWRAAASDDPYADQLLIELEETYERVRDLLFEKITTLSNLLNSLEGMTVSLQGSQAPVVFELRFASPWGYRGAYLLTQFDLLVRLALICNHVGLFLGKEWESTVGVAQRRLRHLFQMVMRFEDTGVTRIDIRAANDVARKAKARFEARKMTMALDPEVMAGRKRARFAPRNRLGEVNQSKERAAALKAIAEENAEAVEAARAYREVSRRMGHAVDAAFNYAQEEIERRLQGMPEGAPRKPIPPSSHGKGGKKNSGGKGRGGQDRD